MKVRDAIKIITEDGWFLKVTKGSHRQFRHLNKSGRVTIAGHLSHELSQGTWNSILKQAQIKRKK